MKPPETATSLRRAVAVDHFVVCFGDETFDMAGTAKHDVTAYIEQLIDPGIFFLVHHVVKNFIAIDKMCDIENSLCIRMVEGYLFFVAVVVDIVKIFGTEKKEPLP